MRDVARASGVSASTVSRALSNPMLVSGRTRARVHEAAARVGYIAHRDDARPARERTGTIGIVVPDLANALFSTIVKGVQARGRSAGYSLLVGDFNEDEPDEVEILRGLATKVDGLILCSPRIDEHAIARLSEELPIVLMHRRFAGIPAITVDSVGGIWQAMAHLAALGHRQVAYIAGPARSAMNAEREQGLRAAGTELGVEVIEPGNFAPTFDGGIAAADIVLASGATGVIGFNDTLTLGVISRLRDRGVKIPEDLSVIGFDDIPMARMASPPLTTVAIPKTHSGRMAAQLLIGQVTGGPEGPSQIEVPAHLMVRSTTSAAQVQPPDSER